MHNKQIEFKRIYSPINSNLTYKAYSFNVAFCINQDTRSQLIYHRQHAAAVTVGVVGVAAGAVSCCCRCHCCFWWCSQLKSSKIVLSKKHIVATAAAAVWEGLCSPIQFVVSGHIVDIVHNVSLRQWLLQLGHSVAVAALC